MQPVSGRGSHLTIKFCFRDPSGLGETWLLKAEMIPEANGSDTPGALGLLQELSPQACSHNCSDCCDRVAC